MPAKTKKPVKTPKYYVVIVELDTKLRGRDKTKPHLYTGMSKTPPEDQLTKIQESRSAGPDYARGRYVKIADANPYAKPRTSAEVARRRCDEQIEKYIRRGHFVNNGEKFHVYVIDLKQDHLKLSQQKAMSMSAQLRKMSKPASKNIGSGENLKLTKNSTQTT